MREKEKGLEEKELENARRGLADGNSISMNKLRDLLSKSGISEEDPRIQETLGDLIKEGNTANTALSREEFKNKLKKPEGEILKKLLLDELIIPDFEDFKKDIEEIFQKTKSNTKGEMNELLPHPAPERQPAFAVSICTVDGQLLQLGDYDLYFLLQSISKPVNYALALEEAGKKKVHEHVGSEPGDESFDSGEVLNENELPHNPMLTSGAMMTSCLIKPDKDIEDRLEFVKKTWNDMTGNKEVKLNDESYEREIKDSNKHFALAHLMQQRGAFPEGVDLETVIKFYLKCNALELNIDALAHAAATLANFGRCPSTGKKVFEHDTVRDTLSLMLTSGMYDHSGEFAFRVGLPAKSGIAGGIMVVVPEVMGISVYSPPLDSHGNTVRGVEFLERLVDKFNFHIYEAVRSDIHGKKDPRNKKW